MDDNRIFDLFQKLADKLQENTDALKNMLVNHESRLAVLETKKDGEGWKSQLLMLLAKAIVIGGVAVASLVGGGSILTKVFGI